MIPAILAMASVLGCSSLMGPNEDEARAKLEPLLAQAAQPGRTGLLLRGKNVWLETSAFDPSCLEEKDLAFNDDPADRPSGVGARISPTYKNQRYLTASTDQGYCVYLGEGLKVELKELAWDRAEDKGWNATLRYTLDKPSPWGDCLDKTATTRQVLVTVGEGEDPTVSIEGGAQLAEGDCPVPLPGGEERTGRSRPAGAAPKAPSRDEAMAAMQRLDQALYDGDLVAALGAMSCYNLFEDPMFGTCSVGEIVALGPLPRGEARIKDGTPWLEYVQDEPGAFTRIVADAQDRSLFHVVYKHKRTGKDRSVSLQWEGGEWKVVGVVGKQSESITTARIVTDLADKRRREIFEKRLAGEKIDEEGNSTIPLAEGEEGAG